MASRSMVQKVENVSIDTTDTIEEVEIMTDWDLLKHYGAYQWQPLAALPLLTTCLRIILRKTSPKVFGELNETEQWFDLKFSIGCFFAVLIGSSIYLLVQEIIERREDRKYPPLSDVKNALLDLEDEKAEKRRKELYLVEYARLGRWGMRKKYLVKQIWKLGKCFGNWELKFYSIFRLVYYCAWVVDLVCVVTIPSVGFGTGFWKISK